MVVEDRAGRRGVYARLQGVDSEVDRRVSVLVSAFPSTVDMACFFSRLEHIHGS